MKTKFIIMLFGILSLSMAEKINAQNPVWTLPPFFLYNVQAPQPLPTPNYPGAFNGQWPDPNLVFAAPHNAYTDINGKPLFFMVNDKVYNKNGYLIDNFIDGSGFVAEGWSETCIVPN
jgi:hypothetical protein